MEALTNYLEMQSETMKEDKLGRQGGSGMKGEDKAAAAAKSTPEWRSRRKTNLGHKALRPCTAAAASRPFGDFGDQQPRH